MSAIFLALKDLKIFFRDKWALFYSFLLPIVLVTIMCLTFGPQGEEKGMNKQIMPVVDLDKSVESQKFLNELKKSEGIKVEILSKQKAIEHVKKGRRTLALVICKGFGAEIQKESKQQKLEIYYDPAKKIEKSILQGLLAKSLWSSFGNGFVHYFAKDAINEMEMPESDRQQALQGLSLYMEKRGISEKDLLQDSPLSIKEISVVGEKSDNPYIAQGVAGTAVMMLLFSVFFAGASLLQEREGGSLRRLLLSPVPRRNILLSKYFSTYIAALIQVIVIFLFGYFVFKLNIFKNLPALIVMALVTIASATSLGMFMAALCKSYRQVQGLTTLIVLTMSALGGSWFPLIIMPRWLRIVGHFTFNAWAMDGFQDILWRGLGIKSILPEIGVLASAALITTILSIIIFERRLKGDFLYLSG
jgi:ABC-type multidrug transport system permease subunit